MASRRILVDTSVIIDFLRKKNKEKSILWKLKETEICFMSSITLFELFSGAKTERHIKDINRLAKWIESIYFNDDIAKVAGFIFQNLKEVNKVIEFRDIFIAATAKSHNCSIATLNKEHFKRINGLTLIEIKIE